MSEFDNGRSTRPWSLYPGSDPAQQNPSPPLMGNYKQLEGHGAWKSSFGSTTSMNAVSFGFVATAIFISMFLIMAILELLFKLNLSLISSSSQHNHGFGGSLESGSAAKSRNQEMVLTTNASGVSVVMPGQKYPTCIAQPAPLIPCTREGVSWPPHHHTFAL